MKALILGHYGGRNFGDELMLAGLVRLLRRKQPVAIRIQTPDGSVSEGLRQLGVEQGYGKSPAAILKGLFWADTVVLGGGTIFHDAYPDERYRGYWRNLLLLSLIFALARILGRHVSLAGIGVGPLRRWRTKAFTTLLKWSAHDISVRDRQSADDLALLPGGRDKVRVAADLSAFADIEPAGQMAHGTGKVIGLSLVPPEVVSGAEPGEVGAFYAALGDQLAGALASGAIDSVILFSANVGKDSDLPVAAQMTDLLATHASQVEHVRFNGDPVIFVQRLAECTQVLAARYHVAIAASTLNVPTLWLAYQRKVMDAAPAYGAAPADIFNLAALCREDDRRSDLFARIGQANAGGAASPRERAWIDPTSALLGAG